MRRYILDIFSLLQLKPSITYDVNIFLNVNGRIRVAKKFFNAELLTLRLLNDESNFNLLLGILLP